VIGSIGQDGTYRTTDGGVTWSPKPAVIPGNYPGIVTQIKMFDHLHGWLSVNGDSKTPALFETTDGALSWYPLSALGGATNFCANGQVSFTTMWSVNSISGIGYQSFDGGKTFSPSGLNSTIGIDFTDNLHGAIIGFDTKNWYTTADGGSTWATHTGQNNLEAWSIYGVQGTSTFYTAAENIGNLTPTNIQRSVDYGVTWNFVSNTPIRSTGHISGVGETLYIQTYYLWKGTPALPFVGPAQMFRSTDRGLSWVPVGGPANDEDTRFWVMGCQANVVIAFDNAGGVWKTEDGGDGAFPQYKFPTFSAIKVDPIEPCSFKDTVLTIQNVGCDPIELWDVKTLPAPPMEILDPATNKPLVMPFVIPPGGKGLVKLRLRPQSAGAYQTQVVLEIERDGVVAYDTISVTSSLKFVNPLTLATKSLQFDSTALCDTQALSLHIDNPGCFSIKLVSSQMKDGLNYTLLTPYSNDSLPPGAGKDFVVRFNPNQLDKDVDSVILTFVVLGKTVRMSVPVTGDGIPDNPKFVMSPVSNVNFENHTRCDVGTLGFTITNPGCTFLNIQLAVLDSAFNPVLANDFKWGYFSSNNTNNIHKGDTMKAAILSVSKKEGTYPFYVRIIHKIGQGKEDTTLLPYLITVTHGTRELVLDDSRRDFDTIGFCETKEITIPILNQGCDTIHDTAVTLTGQDFRISTGPTNAFTLDPNTGSTSLKIKLEPTKTGLLTGTLTFRTDADSAPVRTIALTGYVRPTDTIRFKATATIITVHPGDTSDIIIRPSTNFTHPGLAHIGVTLQYNGDVMEPYRTTGIKTGIVGGQIPFPPPQEVKVSNTNKYKQLPIDIVGTDMQLDSTKPILSMQFRIMMSDSLATDFHIAKFVLNHGDMDFNKCLLGAVSDSGTISLDFRCGDSQLYKVLHFGKDFSIDDGIAPIHIPASPNPVHSGYDNVTIPIKTLRPVSVQFDLCNVAGETVYSSSREFATAGPDSFSIPVEPLPSGVYHYRIHTTDGGRGMVTGEFVVLK